MKTLEEKTANKQLVEIKQQNTIAPNEFFPVEQQHQKHFLASIVEAIRQATDNNDKIESITINSTPILAMSVSIQIVPKSKNN